MKRSIIIFILAGVFALSACNQDTCPSTQSTGRDGPSGSGNKKPDQKLFDKDVR